MRMPTEHEQNYLAQWLVTVPPADPRSLCEDREETKDGASRLRAQAMGHVDGAR